MSDKLTLKDWGIRAFLVFSMFFVPSLFAYRFFIAKNECESHVRAFYDLRMTNPPADTLKKAEDLMYQKCKEENKPAEGYLKLYDNMHKPKPKPSAFSHG